MFGFCRDDLMRELHKKGYSVVPLPEASVHARQVVGRYKHSLYRFGDLVELFESRSRSVPQIMPEAEAAPIDVTQTGGLDGKLGAAVVGRWLGGDKAGVAARLRQSRRFRLKIADVKKEYIDLGVADEFLAKARLRAEMPTIERLMEVDGIYVIASVLKAPSMIIESESGDLVGGEIQASEISSGVSGSIKVSTDGKKLNKVVFKADVPVVFAFQAAKLIYEHGSYVSLHPERDELTLMGKSDSSLNEGWLCDEIGPGIVAFTS